jgi:predicted alpha/beta-hydrolase family hydrolase
MEILRNIIIDGSADKPILLDAFYLSNGKAKDIIIFSHGFKGFKDWGAFNQMAEFFAKEGFVFIKFNYSYNGTTPEHPDQFVDLEAFGNNNYSIELNDLGLVIDHIISGSIVPSAELNINHIYLMGHSRGGGLSIIKAYEDSRISKLLTWAAVNALDWGWKPEILASWRADGVRFTENKRTRQKMPLYYQLAENFLANKDRLNIENAVKHMKIPFMVIHGTDDEIPVNMAITMKGWNTNISMELIPGADHVFGARHPFMDAELPKDLNIALAYSLAFFKA